MRGPVRMRRVYLSATAGELPYSTTLHKADNFGEDSKQRDLGICWGERRKCSQSDANLVLDLSRHDLCGLQTRITTHNLFKEAFMIFP